MAYLNKRSQFQFDLKERRLAYEKRFYSISRKIGLYLKDRRIIRGIEVRDMCYHLGKPWMVSPNTVYEYLRKVEQGIAIGKLYFTEDIAQKIGGGNPIDLEIHERRISDHLAALGIGINKKREIQASIRKIQPRFDLKESTIKPLESLVQ